MEDKFERTGYTAIKSKFVNAPIIDEFPVAMECELSEIIESDNIYAVVGKIINVSADENDKIDVNKLNAIIFDQFQAGY